MTYHEPFFDGIRFKSICIIKKGTPLFYSLLRYFYLQMLLKPIPLKRAHIKFIVILLKFIADKWHAFSLSFGFLNVDMQGLDKISGTLPFLVLYLKMPTRAAPIVGGLALFFESWHGPWYGSARKTQKLGSFYYWSSRHARTNNLPFFLIS